MKIKLILLWPVVNPPSLHHRPCETLQGEVLGNLWVLVLDIGLDRADEQCLQHILDDLGVLVLTMNYVDWTLNNWTCLQFTYIFEKISPVQLANNIPGHFCLRNFMYRSLQQKVQCAIDSWKEVLSFLFTCVHEPGWTWGSQNCWQWCWNQLKLKKKILFLSRKSQQTSPLHLVWWHCWHSSRNSLSEKVRRRKPRRQKFDSKPQS